MEAIQILVVDDETEIADLVEVCLLNEGYQVVKFYDSREALATYQQHQIALGIIDVMMPGMDGMTLCREIRSRDYFPLIMLTAKSDDLDKITGLANGADDYITKPFNPLELVARVKAQLRRYLTYNHPTKNEETSTIEINGLSINEVTHEALLYGNKLNLTPTEFAILLLLCQNRGRVISSEMLFETIWQEKYLESNNTVMVHIRRLREKMNEEPRKPKFIKTVWGVGYKIEANG